MKRIIIPFLLIAACGSMLSQIARAGSQPSDVDAVSTTSVQVDAKHVEALKKVVADFAAAHGFSRGQNATMPRNRKVFLRPGAFSITFRSKDDHYLLMHNVLGKDCVVVDFYATGKQTSYDQLMADLAKTIQASMPNDAKIVDSKVCAEDKL